jgi:phospholipid/cholesterol/gamma-HCH transport system ATP-binding protein
MIRLNNICKSFASKQVLKKLCLEVTTGETLTIIGGSGSGKSVLIKHIIGLLTPDSGEIVIEGTDITKLKEKKLFEVISEFGMVFQGGALFDSLTVGENVIFGVKDKDQISKEALGEIIDNSLEKVGLPGIADLMPAELSGGMKKRVAIARAIAKKPRLLFYDEPTTGLDPIMADVINELIIKVNESPEITSIVITHDMVSAYKISDRIAMLFEGEIIETGTPDQIRQTNNPIVRQFIEGKSDGPIKIH